MSHTAYPIPGGILDLEYYKEMVYGAMCCFSRSPSTSTSVRAAVDYVDDYFSVLDEIFFLNLMHEGEKKIFKKTFTIRYTIITST